MADPHHWRRDCPGPGCRGPAGWHRVSADSAPNTAALCPAQGPLDQGGACRQHPLQWPLHSFQAWEGQQERRMTINGNSRSKGGYWNLWGQDRKGSGEMGRLVERWEVRLRFSEGTDFQPTWDCEKSWWWGRGEVFQLSCKSEACFFPGRGQESSHLRQMKSWIGEQLEFGIKGGEEGVLCLREIVRIELKR